MSSSAISVRGQAVVDGPGSQRVGKMDEGFLISE